MDLNTHFCQSHNETMAWCSDIMSDCDLYRYRPMTEMLQLRNTALHNVMHNRSHQQEY